MYLITIQGDDGDGEEKEVAFAFESESEYEKAKRIIAEKDAVHVDHGRVYPDNISAFVAFMDDVLP